MGFSTAAVRRALLAAGLLAEAAHAFVPGGIVHIPHVRIGSAALPKPVDIGRNPDGRAGARDLPLSKRTSMYVADFAAPMPPPVQPPAIERVQQQVTRVPLVPKRATDIIKQWEKRALVTQVSYSPDRPSVAPQDTLNMLQRMKTDIALGDPQLVFATTNRDGEIQAIATASKRILWTDRRSSKAKEVLYIRDLVVMPGSDQPYGVGPDLYRRMQGYGKLKQYMVMSTPVTNADEKYYTSLGFRLNRGPNNAFRAYQPEDMPSDRSLYHMVRLEVPAQ